MSNHNFNKQWKSIRIIHPTNPNLATVLEYRLRFLTATDSITNYHERKEALPPASLQRHDQHGQWQLQVGTSGLKMYVDDNLFTHSLSKSMNPHLSWPVVTLLANASGNNQYLRSNPSTITAIHTSVCFNVPATIVTNSNDQVYQSLQLIKLGLPFEFSPVDDKIGNLNS
ncbi:protein SCARECROW-like [Forsythia ovata]|uniref:Protein SCARECROW-like n=1 Tax=Forsythia ovata TaxID=205694 RepID=A0ABD1X296_9LAMI